MGRPCPQCEKIWPDHLWTCPRDGAKLGKRIDAEPDGTDRAEGTGRSEGTEREEPTEPKEQPGPQREAHREGEPERDDQDGAAEARSGEAKPEAAGQTGTSPSRPGPKALPRACKQGDILGRYRLVSEIAVGGAATVFKAEHLTLKRRVAIKVLHPELTQRPLLVRRFFTEARAVSQLRHPNIVAITDFVEAADHPPYIVMELLEGHDLRQHLESEGVLPTDEAVSIACQICDAMAAVHKADIVHRDLKAENIFLTENPEGNPTAKLLDFGLAKWISQDDPLANTLSGEVVGTPEYMAPEQIRGEAVDHRVDIYALGVLLYEMLTGEVPFGRDLVGDLLKRQLSEKPRPPSDWIAEKGQDPLPAGLDQIVLTCLAKPPQERFTGMSALKQALELTVEDTGVVHIPLPVHEKKPFRLWTVVAAAALLCAAALVTWGVLAARDRRGDASSRSAAEGERTGGKPGNSRAGPMDGSRKNFVLVTSQPSRASVFRLADGRFMGLTPLEVIPGTDGKQRYALRLDGYAHAEFTIGPGLKGPVQVILKRAEPKAPEHGPGGSGPAGDSPREGRPKGRTGAEARRPGTTRPDTVIRKDGEWGVVDPFKPRGKVR